MGLRVVQRRNTAKRRLSALYLYRIAAILARRRKSKVHARLPWRKYLRIHDVILEVETTKRSVVAGDPFPCSVAKTVKYTQIWPKLQVVMT